MAVTLWLSLRDGVTAAEAEDGGIVVEGQGVRLSIRPDHRSLVEALLGLAPPGRDEEHVADEVLAAGGPKSLAAWYYTIRRLSGRGLICRSIVAGERRLATLVPVSTPLAMTDRPDHPEPPGRFYRLSRFAYLRRDGETMVLESPTAYARIVLDDPAAAALAAGLAVATTEAELSARAAGLPPEAVLLLIGLLADAGMVDHVEAGSGSDGIEDEDRPVSSSLDAWEFHDLLFHARSRRGRTDAPFGGTYRLAGRMEPPSPVRSRPDGPASPLFRPDLERLGRDDPPLSRVVEARRSERVYGHRPLSARQLGEFLYRVARIRREEDVELATPRGTLRMPMASRPYPSGGSLYELELYAAVAACDGVEAGLHYYEPRGHALIAIRGLTPEVVGLLRDAAESAGLPRETLQILLILSARVPRISWKYASMAYSLVLKHVGVVYQSMYLAATAMGLAPCALGAGDSDLFTRASGTDYFAETSVGEFLLGSRPEADSPP